MAPTEESRSSRSLRLLDGHLSEHLGARGEMLRRLRSTYLLTARDERFKALLEDCLQELSPPSIGGARTEGAGIVLLGDTGAGKSRMVKYGVGRHELFDGFMLPDRECAAVGVRCLGAYTLRVLATNILHATGYPVRNLRENHAWIEVRERLEHLGVILLYIDEVNNVLNAANRAELARILNTFKALINHPTWPVVLILSGTPDCEARLRHSGELCRRVRWMSLDPLAASDLPVVRKHVGQLSRKVGLEVPDGLLSELAPRLAHAASGAFGWSVDLTLAAIKAALRSDAQALDMEHFATAYARVTQASRDANPFVVRDWRKINPSPIVTTDGDGRSAGLQAAAAAAKTRARQGLI